MSIAYIMFSPFSVICLNLTVKSYDFTFLLRNTPGGCIVATIFRPAIEFICGESAFELGGTVNENNENIVVGGENKWAYDKFVNYEFFPKGWEDSPQGPILVYFKETQTPQESWNEGPGKSANDPAKIAAGEGR